MYPQNIKIGSEGMITAKQERFVQNLVKGMNQREAHKDAYPNDMTDKQHDEEACKLLKIPKVYQRYNELKEQLTDEAIMSAKDRMKWLTDVVNNNQREEVYIKTKDGEDVKIGDKVADLNVKLKAIDLLNKMDGQYTEKVKIEAEKPFEVNIKVIK